MTLSGDAVAAACDSRRRRGRGWHGAGRDRAADLGEMEGHGLGVGGGHHQAPPRRALRTDGAENVGPFVAVVARCARPRSTRAQTRVRVPCWPIRASSWNQISIGLPLAWSGGCAVTVAAKFF